MVGDIIDDRQFRDRAFTRREESAQKGALGSKEAVSPVPSLVAQVQWENTAVRGCQGSSVLRGHWVSLSTRMWREHSEEVADASDFTAERFQGLGRSRIEGRVREILEPYGDERAPSQNFCPVLRWRSWSAEEKKKE